VSEPPFIDRHIVSLISTAPGATWRVRRAAK